MSGKALLVDLARKGNSFEVRKTHLLNLNDRSIRDITNDCDGYVIISSPVDSRVRPALYAWNGDAPAQKLMRLEGLNAESIVKLGGLWMVLSDDGKAGRPDNETEDDNRKCDSIRKKNSPVSGACRLGRKPGCADHQRPSKNMAAPAESDRSRIPARNRG